MARAPVAAPNPEIDQEDPELGAGERPDAEPAEPASTCIVSICKTPDGAYQVYAGPAPQAGMPEQEDMAEDAATYDGIGAALHRAMEILQDDAEGAEGGAEAQFNAGFDGGAPQA